MGMVHFIVKDVFNALGFDIRRRPQPAEVLAGERHVIDPITFQYLRAPAIVDVALDDVRGLSSLGLPLRADAHPFVRAATIARHAPLGADRTLALREVLSRYYGTVRPASALEALDLTWDDAPGLAGAPPAGWIFPWSDRSVEQTLRGRERAMRLDALQYGRRTKVGSGFTAFGPVGEAKLDLEVRRIEQLVDSLARTGFRVYDRKNPLQVIGLRANGVYRWLIWAGHHRFAACAAFAIRSVPALVPNVVRREDHALWPQVVSGVYHPKGALKVFDRLFRGQAASVCEAWHTAAEAAGTPTAAASPRVGEALPG
jgi:hypothetical protein